MLPASVRMRSTLDFQRTFRGIRVGRPTVVVHAARADGRGHRVGFVVSKKVGNAVVRNRVKRQMRHLVRPLLNTTEDAWFVVRALPAAASSPERLADDLTSAWSAASKRLAGS